MASHPNRHMYFFIAPIICVVTALIFVVVTDPSSLFTSVLDHWRWLLLLLLLALVLLLAFFLGGKRSSSSSTSFVVPERKFEVFLNFRGTDIRYGFLSHLRGALFRKKIDYYFDDQNLQQGNKISPALLAAIERSEISLVIFSENYASSTWCLEELAHIIECMENHNQIVIPIFYKIDPSSIRYQKGSYEDAFARHKKRFDKHKLQKWLDALKKAVGLSGFHSLDEDKLQKWRDALKKAADLSGFHSINYKTEADFITEIVQCVLNKLKMTSYQDDLKGLIGIQDPIRDLQKLLRKKSQNVFSIGIWGTGGIGKTTIAEVLFKRLYNEYEGRCFLRMREGLDEHGTIQLKEELLSKLLGEHPDVVMRNGISPDCERRLQRKKVLVVLDNINKLMQLEILVGKCEWFGSDSKIIVTSRDKDVIKICNFIHEVKPLRSEEDLQLFNLHALPEICLDKEHEWYKLSKLVVEHAKGNPLAIKVLGSSLSGSRNKSEWESKLKKLEKILDPEIQKILKLSYDDLDDEQKDIFLYLACFFREDLKKRIISLLDDDNYHIIDGLRVLQNRALITISGRGYVSMHDLIQKMGHEIVRQKYPKNPGQRNHLWNADDIYEVFNKNKGTEEIESIRLDMLRLTKDLHLGPQAFGRMDNLKLLRFEVDYPVWMEIKDYSLDNRFRVHVPEEDIILPDKLISFQCDFYPSKSPRLRSCLENLVELSMRHSGLQRLWDDIQEFPKLKIIDLSFSKELYEFPDLSNAQNLERVYLKDCSSLTKLNIGHLPSLEKLSLRGANVETLPTSIKHSSRLRHLDVENCRRLRSLQDLPSSIEKLFANDCSSLETLQFNSMPLNLVELYMQHNNLVEFCIQELPKLKIIDLSCSKQLVEFPDLTNAPNLVELDLMGCEKLERLGSRHISSASLISEISEEHDRLDLSETMSSIRCIPNGLHPLTNLERLDLSDTNVETLPTNIKRASRLRILVVDNCRRLRSLQELPSSIEFLNAHHCPSLETLQFHSMPLSRQCSRVQFAFYDCPKLDENAIEAIAKHYLVKVPNVVKLCVFDGDATLQCPGSKVPKCLGDYRTTQGSVLVTLELALLYTLKGFILYSVFPPQEEEIYLMIDMEVTRNGQKLLDTCIKSPKFRGQFHAFYINLDDMFMRLSLELAGENFKSRDSASDLKFSFEINDRQSKGSDKVKEWGVCPVYI